MSVYVGHPRRWYVKQATRCAELFIPSPVNLFDPHRFAQSAPVAPIFENPDHKLLI